jgi:hypothetical protein
MSWINEPPKAPGPQFWRQFPDLEDMILEVFQEDELFKVRLGGVSVNVKSIGGEWFAVPSPERLLELQKLTAGPKCPRCHEAVMTAPLGGFHCQTCDRPWHGYEVVSPVAELERLKAENARLMDESSRLLEIERKWLELQTDPGHEKFMQHVRTAKPSAEERPCTSAG